MSEGDGPPNLQYEDETLIGKVATEATGPLETPGYHGGTTLSPDPFVELANRIQNFFTDHNEDKSAQRKLRAELRRFGPLQEDSVNAIEAQVRQYCELMGTMFPSKIITAGPFKSYLVRDMRENLAGRSSAEDIAVALNFEKPRPVLNGISTKLLQIKKSSQGLEDQPNEDQIKGAVVGAFGKLETILAYLISFYGRLLAEVVSSPTDFINPLIAKGKELQEALKTAEEKPPDDWPRQLNKWRNTFGQPGSQAWAIGTTQATWIIEMLNHWWQELVKEHGFLLAHFGQLGISEIMEVGLLKEFRAFYSERALFAHGDQVPDLLTASEIVRSLYGKIAQLEEKAIVPPVHVVERRITMCDGTTRLDCRDEMGVMRRYRFRETVRFYPLEECFFSVADRDLKRVANDRVCKLPPIILPVDINCRKKPI